MILVYAKKLVAYTISLNISDFWTMVKTTIAWSLMTFHMQLMQARGM
jgi:hypothetical protein